MKQPRVTESSLRKSIVKACQALFHKNFVAATDGNVSARFGADRILVTPSGVSKGDVRERDILLCDFEGRKISGNGAVSSEIQVHLAGYRARDTIRGIVHAHPPVATAITFAGLEALLLEPIVPEVVSQIGPIPTVPYILPGSTKLSAAVEPALRQSDIVMLSRHGAVTVGGDPWAAYLRMEKLEYLATIIKNAHDLNGAKNIRRMTQPQIEELKSGYGKVPQKN
jgi:L-fuculose-phosphate aldolase